ncbi:hypothetical protein ACFZC6_29220 [Streptomyces ossamyceticus]|uniref:hypothetical protein n=1 Tax=Streptomyces ossamyceticus TaxID=249581 RepID=UPI0036ECFA6D
MYVAKNEQAHCPGCRALRPVRILGTATVGRRTVRLAHCLDPACDLVWSVRTDVTATPRGGTLTARTVPGARAEQPDTLAPVVEVEVDRPEVPTVTSAEVTAAEPVAIEPAEPAPAVEPLVICGDRRVWQTSSRPSTRTTRCPSGRTTGCRPQPQRT